MPLARVNDKIKVVDSIKTLNEKLHSDGINEKLRSQFVVTLKLIPKAVVLIVDVFFHDMCPPYVNLILR